MLTPKLIKANVLAIFYEHLFAFRFFLISLPSAKIGCASTMKTKSYLFCIAFGFHYLCIRFMTSGKNRLEVNGNNNIQEKYDEQN